MKSLGSDRIMVGHRGIESGVDHEYIRTAVFVEIPDQDRIDVPGDRYRAVNDLRCTVVKSTVALVQPNLNRQIWEVKDKGRGRNDVEKSVAIEVGKGIGS